MRNRRTTERLKGRKAYGDAYRKRVRWHRGANGNAYDCANGNENGYANGNATGNTAMPMRMDMHMTM